MAKSLEELHEVLLQGQKLSMQGSLDRRLPDKKAVPYLLEARTGLREYINENPMDAPAWRLLSRAEETLLNYKGALECLEKAIELSGKDKADLKKLALLKEMKMQWEDLQLSPEQLESLGEYVYRNLNEFGCNHTLLFTKEWLDGNVPKVKKSKIVKAIQNRGGFCDCEVLANVVD